jgi:integrase
MRKLLTATFIRSLEKPAVGRIEVADLRCVGLTIRVTSSGAKSWSLRFRDPRSKKVTRATIGSYPEITLEKAREKGLDLRREVAEGINPVQRKRKDRAEANSRTFQALAERYVTEHARRHKKTADADERALRLHILPHWANLPFDNIGRREVIALCEGIVAQGKLTQANRVQALVSKVFSFAIDLELLSANPCARLKKRSKEVKITRVLSDDEIRLFWHRIGEPPNSVRIGEALRLILLTGVRVTEMAGAEIKEFDHIDDPNSAVWTIPAVRSKNGRAHVVPLSPLALDIVLDLLKQADGRASDEMKHHFIMQSPVKSEKPIEGHALSVAMRRFGDALHPERNERRFSGEEGRAITTWAAERPTAHDLRRTMATRMAGSGIPAEDVSACLNHARKGVTATHYDHYDRAREKRRALVEWSEQVESIVRERHDRRPVVEKAVVAAGSQTR